MYEAIDLQVESERRCLRSKSDFVEYELKLISQGMNLWEDQLQ